MKDVSGFIEEFDQLMKNNETEKAFNILLPFKDSEDDEILWRLAQSLYDMTYNKKTTDETKRMIADALHFTEKALEINEKNAEAHKMMAAVLDAHYKNVSVRARVEQCVNAKKHMLRAAELNPEDPHVCFMLGLFYFNIADLSWPLKKLTQVVFSTNIEATFDEALTEFENVLTKKNPKEYKGYKSVLYMIGHCHLKIGNKVTAAQYLKQSLETPGKSPSDIEAQMEASKLLKTLQKA